MIEELRLIAGTFQPGSFPMWGTFVLLLGWAVKASFENRKLRIAEKVDDRDGYGVLIKALQDDVATVRVDHRRCEDRLSKIEGELMGFHRQALVQSQQMAAPLPASTMVKDAGERAVAAATKALEEKL